MPNDPRRILIVRLSHLGDVVHALPVYHAVRAAFPRAEIAWAVQSEFSDLVRGLGGIARTLCFERRGGALAWPKVWRETAGFAPDWTIDAQGNVKSALVTIGSRAPRRSGLDRGDWTEPIAAGVLTDSAPLVARDALDPVHAVDRMIALARHVAPNIENVRCDPDPSARELVEGHALATRIFDDDSRRPTILHLSTQSDVRSWPIHAFVELAQSIADERSVLVLSGPSEEVAGRDAKERLAHVPRIAHWPGQRGLRTLAAFFTAVAARDGVFVGCDSGPLHLAAACGLGVVALAGPQDPRRTGPWPVVQSGTRGAHALVRASRVPECAPCSRRTCSHPEGPVCMSRISAADVRTALNRLEPTRPT